MSYFESVVTQGSSPTAVCKPAKGEILLLKCVILTAPKQRNGYVTVVLTDDVATKTLYSVCTTENAINVQLCFDELSAWVGARLEVQSTHSSNVFCGAHYESVPPLGNMDFANWGQTLEVMMDLKQEDK